MKKTIAILFFLTTMLYTNAQEVKEEVKEKLSDSSEFKAYVLEKKSDKSNFIVKLESESSKSKFILIIPKSSNEKLDELFNAIKIKDLIVKRKDSRMIRIAHFEEDKIDVKSFFY